MIYTAEVVAVLARDYCELVWRMPRIWIYLCGEIVVAFSRAPVALLVFLNEFGFAVAGEIAELDERLVARDEDRCLEFRGYALTR